MSNAKELFRRKVALTLVFVVGFMVVTGVFAAGRAYAASETETEHRETVKKDSNQAAFAYIAAAIAFGFGAIGAGIGIANVGSAAMGAISEKPEIAGQALIFVALAEGLVVFGFITALIIVGKV